MKPYEPYLLMERESVTVPLVNGSNLQWLVTAKVNGQQGLFILDTGANSTIITPQFAGQLGLTNAAEIRTTRIEETGQNIENVPLQSFRLGALEYFNFYVTVLNLDHITKAIHSEIAGIIGNNLLNQTAYRIDWRNNQLTLYTRRDPTPSNAIPIHVRGNRISLPVRVNGRKMEFALDTGAYRCLITEKQLSQLNIPAEKKRIIEVPQIDINQSRREKRALVELHSFELGNIHRSNFPILVWDHAVLGMDLLQNYILTVDARQNWMLLTDYPETGKPK